MRPVDIAGLFALGALWGASFLFMRVAAPEFNPVPVADIRVVIGGLLLLLVAVPQRVRFEVRAMWRPYLVLGLMNTAVPFALISAAATQLPASISSILIATTPIFAALVGWVWLRDPLTGRQIVGVLLGLVGVVLLVGWTPLGFSVPVVLSIVAVIGAALCYGVGTHYSARMLRRKAGLAIPVIQQFAAAALLLPLALASVPATRPSDEATLSVLALGLFSTGLAYLLFFRLMRRIGPFRANIATYFTPAFGVLWGALLLDERLSAGTFVGLAIILVSAVMMGNLRLSPSRGRRASRAGLVPVVDPVVNQPPRP
ncbi:MAG: Permease of the drug/metabolite transporter (DMT) superfamily [uncultured Thermomicrobiales bacterium]|uniref:Permease of the drug/metabolite transporter (DMT) superfamily n=1 Tax=uncultured Thermomicrobiales bacterium TaxID=1645740 RepID=A0A6J4UHI9_9BACT|nr:MAG: Permease of the drug/metabolite transporter (DMT) superfamily [uncultured Thermomicrobiales bacterium]